MVAVDDLPSKDEMTRPLSITSTLKLFLDKNQGYIRDAGWSVPPGLTKGVLSHCGPAAGTQVRGNHCGPRLAVLS